MRFRSSGSLGAELIGRRVTVRVRDDDGSARDLIGVLTAIDGTDARIARADGRVERIELARVIAAREIRPVRKPGAASGPSP